MSAAQYQVSDCAPAQASSQSPMNVSSTALTDVFKTFPRADKTLQDIVYKLVPGLFKGKPENFQTFLF